MNERIASMERISKASEDIAKIIKTVDKIAVQALFLRLNASIEAA